MGDGVLLLRRQLGEGLFQLGHEEDGVEAEAPVPHGRKGDGAAANALCVQLVPVGEAAGDVAGEVAGTGELPLHGAQEHLVLLRLGHARLTVTGAIHPGAALEGVHAETGVVCDGRQAAGFHDGLRLDFGVLGKGGASFVRLQVQSHVGLQDHFHAQLTQDFL